jgi:biopolymer transport protein ExbB/TolQ
MRANDSVEEIELAMDYATLEAIPKVTRLVGFLGTTANVATLFGLMGTLFGLMHSFAAAANATGAQKQTLLAEGIAEALVATSFGLGTALVVLLAYGILMIKQAALVDDINANAARLLHMLYNRKMKIHRGGSDRAE